MVDQTADGECQKEPLGGKEGQQGKGRRPFLGGSLVGKTLGRKRELKEPVGETGRERKNYGEGRTCNEEKVQKNAVNSSEMEKWTMGQVQARRKGSVGRKHTGALKTSGPIWGQIKNQCRRGLKKTNSVAHSPQKRKRRTRDKSRGGKRTEEGMKFQTY